MNPGSEHFSPQNPEELLHSPFKQPLINSDIAKSGPQYYSEPNQFYKFQDRDDFVVRKSEEIDEDGDKALREDALGNYAETNKMYLELRDKYHIAIPKFQFIAGDDVNTGGVSTPVIYTVVEKIEGTNLSYLLTEDIDPILVTEIDKLFKNLVHYTKDHFVPNSSYLTDFKPANFVYGRNKQGAQGIYFIDVEPGATAIFDSLVDLQAVTSLGESMQGLRFTVEKIEQNTGKTLVEARAALGQFYRDINEMYVSLIATQQVPREDLPFLNQQLEFLKPLASW